MYEDLHIFFKTLEYLSYNKVFQLNLISSKVKSISDQIYSTNNQDYKEQWLADIQKLNETFARIYLEERIAWNKQMNDSLSKRAAKRNA